ncbi:glycoside hydrolase family 3 N-terminal domain-containing protein [Lapidilactobacillus luobeiensis]|uniref:glycoside hydrolase family 3 N-terminal domain-containing protein n=1 Tax=Lapidilactobacillus luobeiensis TaxID=2950371 RepID=UPI0021C2AFAA|nr:glycoside hydrolase family 3 N-terminal domain-containing protein [Lapidilactobacillus luobeiensis]
MEQTAIKQLLEQMSVQEKVAQLSQLTPQFLGREQGVITGPLADFPDGETYLNGLGSVLGTTDREEVIAIQKEHLAHDRLKIPLIFMQDVIHGYRTIFPIPLGLGSTFDPELVEILAHAAGAEAAQAGINVTFSPMADLVRDARWGRVMESTGEDSYLNSVLAAAMVRGYQGAPADLATDFSRIAACVKHFVGYGAAEAGRDYDTVDLSRLALAQDYLPAFAAAIDAGAKLVMPAFTLFEGVPAAANHFLIQQVLREQLHFDGTVISDWGALRELVSHGVAADLTKASEKAFNAGVDMDMMSGAYLTGLTTLIKNGQIAESLVDQAVLRILTLKNDLGLFEHPYRQVATALVAPESAPTQATRALAYQAAVASTVLLKNEQILPLSEKCRLAVTGPFADTGALLGSWHCQGRYEDTVTVLTGLQQQFEQVTVLPAPVSADPADYNEVDAILVTLGERENATGEASSQADLSLPPDQIALVKALKQTGKPIIAVIFSGRPLVLTAILPEVTALFYAWYPGTEGGTALAALLRGQALPQGRLAMTLPRATGQTPLYYNKLRVGRPANQANTIKYSSRFMDVANGGLFDFGFGLGYSPVSYTAPHFTQAQATMTMPAQITTTVTNTGDYPTIETVQCYLSLTNTEVVRPQRQLCHWQKVTLAPGASTTVKFDLTAADLAYVHSDLQRRTDEGPFQVYVGPNSQTELSAQGTFNASTSPK